MDVVDNMEAHAQDPSPQPAEMQARNFVVMSTNVNSWLVIAMMVSLL